MTFVYEIYDVWLRRESVYECNTLEFTRVGTLSAPSGRIVACDPILLGSPRVPPELSHLFPEMPSGNERERARPFGRAIHPGRYPVFVCSADGRPAYAILRISKKRPIRWETAVWEVGDEHAGYGVSSGIGCFADQLAEEALVDVNVSVVDETGGTGTFDLAEEGLNVVCFETGGDGVFTSFWGLDKNGEPVCLATDFGAVMTQEETSQLPVRPLRLERKGEKFVVFSSNEKVFAETARESEGELLIEADKYFHGKLFSGEVRDIPITYRAPVAVGKQGEEPPGMAELRDAAGHLIAMIRRDEADAMAQALNIYHQLRRQRSNSGQTEA